MIAPKVQLAVLQATPFCNINCSYCYLPDRSATQRMQPGTLAAVAQRLFESPLIGDELTVVWHAGEPLVVPMNFYQEAYDTFQLANKGRTRLVFSFQTNAMLVTERWCEFFRQTGSRVGVSLDGPRHLHDAHRVDRVGRGTFGRAMRGLKLLQAAGIGPSVIMVLTSTSLDQPEEIWHFLVDNHIRYVGFNPEEAEGTNVISSVHDDDSERRYSRFLRHFLALNQAAGEPVRLREYESTLAVLQAGGATASSHDNVPLAIVNIDHEGNISTFSPELLTAKHSPFGSFIFGNVLENALTDILENPHFRTVNAAIQRGVQQCGATCDYFRFCGGGSPSNKIVEAGAFTVTETRSCRMRIKIAVSSVADHLRQCAAAGQSPTVAGRPEQAS